MNDLVVALASRGRWTIAGRRCTRKDVSPIAVRRRIGMVFQKPNPFPSRSTTTSPTGRASTASQQGQAERDRRALAAPGRAVGRGQGPARQFGPEPVRRAGAAAVHRPHARRRADVVLMDEPASALDPIATGAIEDLMRRSSPSTPSSSSPTTCSRPRGSATGPPSSPCFSTTRATPAPASLVEYGPTEQIFGDPQDERTRPTSPAGWAEPGSPGRWPQSQPRHPAPVRPVRPGQVDHPAGDVDRVVSEPLVEPRHQGHLHRHRQRIRPEPARRSGWSAAGPSRRHVRPAPPPLTGPAGTSSRRPGATCRTRRSHPLDEPPVRGVRSSPRKWLARRSDLHHQVVGELELGQDPQHGQQEAQVVGDRRLQQDRPVGQLF